jgi:hypothetical protein
VRNEGVALGNCNRGTFPLSDAAVSLEPANIMVTLSPRLLVEINLRDRGVELCHRNRIAPEKLAEFKRRTISPDGKRLVSGSRDHSIIVWDTKTAQEVLTLNGHSGSVRSVV